MPDRRSEYRGPHTAYEGWYQLRLVKRGPWVAAELRWQDDRLVAYIDGERSAGPMGSWEMEPVDVITLFGEAITAAEHHYLITLAAWARKHDPQHPLANPRKPVSLRLLRPDQLYQRKVQHGT